MATHGGVKPESRGYVLVLFGAAGFVVSCFLPYVDADYSPAFRSPSLFRLFAGLETQVAGSPVPGWVGAPLSLFAAVGAIVWVSVSALRRPRGWQRQALVALAIAWCGTWMGTILTQRAIFPGHGLGYWLILASVGVVTAGAALVWISARRARVSTPDTTAVATDD